MYKPKRFVGVVSVPRSEWETPERSNERYEVTYSIHFDRQSDDHSYSWQDFKTFGGARRRLWNDFGFYKFAHKFDDWAIVRETANKTTGDRWAVIVAQSAGFHHTSGLRYRNPHRIVWVEAS